MHFYWHTLYFDYSETLKSLKHHFKIKISFNINYLWLRNNTNEFKIHFAQ